MTGGNPMEKNITRIILALMLFLTLSGCAGLGNYTDSTDYDDGFYPYGKGKHDWTYRY
jgi:uncharacterized protein YceK